MNQSRRNFLKNTIVGVSALSYPLIASSSDLLKLSPISTSTALIAIHSTQGAIGFLEGVQQTSIKDRTITTIGSYDSKFISKLYKLFMQDDHLRLIGFVDQATAILVLNLTRNTNAKIEWAASHLIDGRSALHTITDITLSRPYSALLSDISNAEEKQLISLPDPSTKPIQQINGSSDWSRELGYQLAIADPNASCLLPNQNKPQSISPTNGHYVSFAINI